MSRRHSRRQSVTFTDDAAQLVEKLATERGISVSEVVREALTREAWFDGVKRQGRHIYVGEDPESVHEVQFLG
jgi:hypothetical protein